MPQIRLLQFHDSGGYRIVVEPAPKRRKPVRKRIPFFGLGWPEPVLTVLEDAFEPEPTTWIVCNSRKLDTIKVRFEKRAIYKQLAKVELTPEGALKFVERYGFLSTTGYRERVEDIYIHIRTMRWLLDAAKHDEWDAIDYWLLDHPIQVNTHIGTSKAGRPQMEDQPTNLFSAIYRQLLLDATGGKDSKLCRRPGCGEDFYYGPNTDHRSSALYCSNGCRVKHFIERKEQSK